MNRIWEFCCEESAATAVEYAVMLALIIAVCIASITLVGGGTFNFWNNNSTQLDNAFSAGS
jgi:pilus assembly protein Flp/PilA